MFFFLSAKLSFNWKLFIGGSLATLLVVFLSTQKFEDLFREKRQISHTNDVTMHFKSVSNISTDASNKERINRWKCALRMFADKPLMGFGPGTYQFFYGTYQHRIDLTRISTFNGDKGHAHSEYLNYLSETGFPGLLIFLSLLSVTFAKGYSLITRSRNRQVITYSMFITCSLITFFVHGFFNGFLEFDKMAMPVFCSMAAILSLDLKEKQLNTEP
jgi:O-antigen ligase